MKTTKTTQTRERSNKSLWNEKKPQLQNVLIIISFERNDRYEKFYARSINSSRQNEKKTQLQNVLIIN